ncbi:coiled-coil domain-containing protein 42 [Cariama cristata]|nr:PREDICTED: coiled-coil domain-containing protein 42A [Cariama cristata]
MATMTNEDLLAYFCMHYRENFLPLLRKLRLTQEESLSPFICFLQKRRQARQIQEALEVKEEEFKKRMQVLSCRWRDLQAKGAQLKTYMEKSERFLKENDKIRVRVLKRVSTEREGKMQKQSELWRAKRELEALKNEHQKLRNKVQKYSIFKKYLEDVVEISRFEKIQEVVWRYRMLMKTHNNQVRSQQAQKDMSEQAKVLLDQYIAEKEAEMLQYKTELVQLQPCLEQVQSDVLPWEACLADIQNSADMQTLKLATIKLAISNIFQCMNMQLKANLDVPVDDSHRQLNMIQRFIEDLRDIAMEPKQDDTQNQRQASTPTEL